MREEKAWLSKGELGKGKKKEWCGALCYRDRNKGRASRVKGEKKPCLLQYKVGSDDLLTIRPINRPTGQQGDRQLAGWQVTAIFSSPTDSCASIPSLSITTLLNHQPIHSAFDLLQRAPYRYRIVPATQAALYPVELPVKCRFAVLLRTEVSLRLLPQPCRGELPVHLPMYHLPSIPSAIG